jgi:hypothetical protein
VEETEINMQRSEVLRSCPSTSPISFASYWYSLPDLSDFEICSKCYHLYIRSTPFASNFKRSLTNDGLSRTCDFNTPRVLSLWNLVQKSSNLEGIKAYIEHRITTPSCHGVTGVSSGDGIQWFSIKSGEVEDFVVCQACYEDFVLATPFSQQFQHSQRLHPQDQIWSCDLAIPVVQRSLKEFSKTNDWRSFVNLVQYRMKISPCAGSEGEVMNLRKWYQRKGGDVKLFICEACYYDLAALSPLSSVFEPYHLPLADQVITWACDMTPYPLAVAWKEALDTNNYQLWSEAAKVFMTNPPCSSEGITDGEWYVLAAGSENFDVCKSCYFGIFRSRGLRSQLKIQPYPAGTTRYCDFEKRSDRYQFYIAKLDEAIDMASFSIFSDYVQTYSTVPVCARANPVCDRVWYGTVDFLACEDCYLQTIKDTSLEAQVTHRRYEVAGATHCDFYSPDMRRAWLHGCSVQDISDVITYARQLRENRRARSSMVRNISLFGGFCANTM